MDQVKSHKIASLIESINTHDHLVKLTQLLVSVSLFLFLFSSSPLVTFLHHFNFYFSTFSFQLFSHTIDKNYMFLLCNGLLVFVGITRSLSGHSGVDESSQCVEGGSQSPYSDVEVNKPMLVEKTKEPDEHNIEANQAIQIKYYNQEVEEKIEKIILEDEEEGKEVNQSVLKEEEEEPHKETELYGAGDEDEDKDSEINEFMIEERVEEEETKEEEANRLLSTEELNKKFDDFIRRMKEELRIQAQRQLIMV
ncbi:uncharacterized protein LOC133307621 [Gastrolobium bilobum]|uniref:uncharacterized protein LOC133307621 n=1 Tax=Gastrolobium bilobum TaxID=150636 RepID=UPI002AB0540B|nr:uncharacterized protein LOC133307621 [Gastrolobium bilobum]